MAQPKPCQVCEERPADVLFSLTETGASEYVCLVCLPFRVADLFAQAGMPGLQFGFEGAGEAESDGPPPPDQPETPQEAPEASGSPGRAEPRLRAVGDGSGTPGGRKRASRTRKAPPRVVAPEPPAADD